MGPLEVRVYQQAKSTQDIARTFAPRPALVLADHQTSGRGRLGRSWMSEPGKAVLMSLVWPTATHDLTHDRVSMLTGYAVARTAQRLLPGVAVRIKWPNDVMIEQRKVAGILIDAVDGAFIIGIGLNVGVSQTIYAETEQCSASLCEFGQIHDRLPVIEQLVNELRTRLRGGSLSPSEWRRLNELGQTQTFEQAGQRITGEVLDLDPDHGLIIRRDTGEIVTLPAATTSVVK
ncbi:MAG: biotin--[acetyl-CoA-carboxylase] ligase [Planctomycetota bacterium]